MMTESEQQTEDICWKVYPDPTDIRKRDDLGKALTFLCNVSEERTAAPTPGGYGSGAELYEALTDLPGLACTYLALSHARYETNQILEIAPMGAPLGNQNGVKAKRWSQAIDRALEKRSKRDGIVALDDLAEKLLTLAEAGDLGALKELGDRIEGKPQMQIVGGGDGGEFEFTKIVREIVDAK
jgi:hypothetical protein